MLATFIALKRWMAEQAEQAERDPRKRRRDVLQADTVQEVQAQYLPED